MNQKQLLIIVCTVLLVSLSIITAIRFLPFSTSLDFQKITEPIADLTLNELNPITETCPTPNDNQPQTETLTNIQPAEIITLESPEDIKQLINHEGPMVMKFSAEWCPACKVAKVQYPEIAQTFNNKVTFYAIDAQNNQVIDALKQANILTVEIEAIPTFVLYQKGKSSEVIRGFSRENLEATIKKHFGI